MSARRSACALQREVWTELGHESPDWAVLTESREWAANQDRFYASGRSSVEDALRWLGDIPRRRALDFGAGTGRLSFALAGEFDEVCAVDHSETMRGELQRRGQTAGLKIRIVDQLPEDETFDFVLSLLVLQHLPGRRAMARTFSALLNRVAPGGGFAIEVPLRPHNALSYLQPRFHAYAFARFLGIPARFLRRVGLSGISMRSLPEDRIRLVIGAAGCRLLDVKVRSADRWQYALYLGARPPSPSEH